MSSRYSRSPPGRRVVVPERSSTGTFGYNSYDQHYDRDRQGSVTSPRQSNDRVIPISKETYVNGVPVPSKRSSITYDPYYDPSRPPSVTSPTRSTAPRIRPSTVVHNPSSSIDDAGARPPSKREYDDYYVTPASSSSSGRERRKVYNVDGSSSSQASDQPDRAQRIVDDRSGHRKAYHLSGPISRGPDSEEPGYEYTDARGMYRDTEPRWRPRRGSADQPTRERPPSVVESMSQRPYPRDGPPPATRALDRVKGGVSRTTSLRQEPRPYSHDRERSRTYDDGDYTIPPRIPASRGPPSSVDRYSDISKIPSDNHDERRESRREKERFQDREVASRGFGIRSASVDPPGRPDETSDRAPGYVADAYERSQAPREFLPETGRNERRREPEPRDREPKRDREYEHDHEYEPVRERTRDKERTRDTNEDRKPRDRDYPPDRERGNYASERDHGHYDERRDREPYKSERREADREDKWDHDHYDERREREAYKPERREADREDKRGSDNESNVGKAALATAAAGAVGYGASRAIGNHGKHRDERRADDYDDDDEKRYNDREDGDTRSRRGREEDEATKKGKEVPGSLADDHSDTHASDSVASDRSAPTQRRPMSPEAETPRERHYVGKEDKEERSATQPRDPDEDYRERMKIEAERVKQLRAGAASAPPREAPLRDDHSSDSGYGSVINRAPVEPYKPISEVPEQELARDKPRAAADRYKPPEYLERERGGNGESPESSGDETMALVRANEHILNAPLTGESAEVIEPSRENRVRIVEPPKEKDMPKSILRKPTAKFPEDPNPIREGVAPLKDAKKKDAPPNARWTKINRKLVNPDALREAQERFEERQDFVIVLRVLSKEEIQKLADRTKEIREERYDLDRDRRHRHRHAEEDGSE